MLQRFHLHQSPSTACSPRGSHNLTDTPKMKMHYLCCLLGGWCCCLSSPMGVVSISKGEGNKRRVAVQQIFNLVLIMWGPLILILIIFLKCDWMRDSGGFGAPFVLITLNYHLLMLPSLFSLFLNWDTYRQNSLKVNLFPHPLLFYYSTTSFFSFDNFTLRFYFYNF